MSGLILKGVLFVAWSGAVWYFGWRQGKRGLGVISQRPRL